MLIQTSLFDMSGDSTFSNSRVVSNNKHLVICTDDNQPWNGSNIVCSSCSIRGLKFRQRQYQLWPSHRLVFLRLQSSLLLLINRARNNLQLISIFLCHSLDLRNRRATRPTP